MNDISSIEKCLELLSTRVEEKPKNLDTLEDITLEQGLLREKAEFFEDVFGITPVLRRKKTL